MGSSNIFHINNNLCDFSRDGKWVASACQNILDIKRTVTLERCNTFNCTDIIDYIEWSPDSELILCAFRKRGIIQVFSLQHPDRKYKLREGSAGIERVSWGFDSRHVLTTAKFHIWVCIWNLVDLNVSYIYYPKARADPAFQFSSNGEWLAVVENGTTSNLVTLFFARTWKLAQELRPSAMRDVGGLAWSPDNELLCLWSGDVAQCHVLVHSTREGRWLGEFRPQALGVRRAAWSPSGQFLAVSCHHDTVFLLNHITWRPTAQFCHSSVVTDPAVKVFNQKAEIPELVPPPRESTFEVLADRPVTLTFDDCDPGVGLMEFSDCGRFLATRYDRLPAAVWVWSVSDLRPHSLLVFLSSVSDLSWEPGRCRLAVATGAHAVSLWSLNGVESRVAPGGGAVGVVSWHPRGARLLLRCKGRASILDCE